MVKYVLGFLFFWSSAALGQTFYVSANLGVLKRVTINGSNVTYKDISVCNGQSIASIAIYKNTLYAANGYIQYKGTISGNSVVNCTPIANIPLSNSLTVDVNNVLYSVNGADLYTTDANNVTKLLGTMPYVASGDLAFFSGKLYMASTKGIVEVNIAAPHLSTLIIPTNLTIWGITTVAYSSTQNKLYAMALDYDLTDVYDVDVSNNKLGGIVATLPFGVGDAASDAESGALLPIEITSVQAISDCPYTGKGTVKIICDNALIDYTYTLNGITNNTGIFNNVTAGNYTVTVKSAVETVTKNVDINFALEKPTLTITKTNPTCVTTGGIKIGAANNGDLYSIQYGGSLYNFDKTFENLTSGNYHFDILSKNGCKVDEVNITLTRELCLINVAPPLITEECDKPGFAKIVVNTLAHLDSYTYQLDGGINNASGTFSGVSPGSHKVKITSVDDEKVVDIVVPDYNAAKPNVQFIVNNLLCEAPASVKLAMANANDYKILFNNALYAFDHVFTFTVTGNYHFEIIKPDGCVLKTIDVPVGRSKCEIELLAPALEQDCDVIFKGRVQVNSKPHAYAYTYKLSSGVVNNDGLFTNLSPGDYSVTVSSIEDSKQLDITIPDYRASSPVVSIDKTDAECDLQGLVKFNISANSAQYTIKLDNSTFPFDHQFKLSEGGYDFAVFKPNGCIFDSYHIDIAKLPCDVMKLPSAFTPNGDGINDIFEPNQGSDAANYNLKVYNRNGILLFNSNALQNGWRGEHNGKVVVAGVYYWLVTYTNNTGQNLKKSGSVVLIR